MSLIEHLHLFAGYGIEMEYMIVDRQTLALRPLCDYILTEAAGSCVNEVAFGAMAWSNELVLHVIELKTNGPAKTLTGLHELFLRDIRKINQILAAKNAMLMPTAMHPFMNPVTDTKLWIEDDAEVYQAYDRIFGCKGHGWSNLQSVHINFPFYNDEEFGKLHAAIRVILPILPALAASSPVYEGKVSGLMDSRLEFYRHNQKVVPEIAGKVIPEPAFTEKAYGELIFAKIYKAIAPHDSAGILRNEWLNSRGAIARFDRHAIEIRLLDIQESPRMDLAVISSVVSAVQALVLEKWGSLAKLQAWSEDTLSPLFVECLRHGSEATIDHDDYLKVFGYPTKGPIKAQELWRHITDDLLKAATYPISSYQREVDALVRHGCLARRLVKALGPQPDAERIHGVYGQLCHLLPLGGSFDAPC